MAQFEMTVTSDRRIENLYDDFDTWLVQFDKLTTSIRFKIPRYWNGSEVDLNDNDLYVNAVTADGKHWPQTPMTKLPSSDPDYIYAEWWIDRNLTAYAGGFSFLICAKATDGDQTVEAWHSHPYRNAVIEKGIEPNGPDDLPEEERVVIKNQLEEISKNLATVQRQVAELIEQGVPTSEIESTLR